MLSIEGGGMSGGDGGWVEGGRLGRKVAASNGFDGFGMSILMMVYDNYGE